MGKSFNSICRSSHQIKAKKLSVKSANLTQNNIHDGGIKGGVAVAQFGVEYHGSWRQRFANRTLLGRQSGHAVHAVVIKQSIVFPNTVLKKKGASVQEGCEEYRSSNRHAVELFRFVDGRLFDRPLADGHGRV